MSKRGRQYCGLAAAVLFLKYILPQYRKSFHE